MSFEKELGRIIKGPVPRTIGNIDAKSLEEHVEQNEWRKIIPYSCGCYYLLIGKTEDDETRNKPIILKVMSGPDAEIEKRGLDIAIAVGIPPTFATSYGIHYLHNNEEQEEKNDRYVHIMEYLAEEDGWFEASQAIKEASDNGRVDQLATIWTLFAKWLYIMYKAFMSGHMFYAPDMHGENFMVNLTFKKLKAIDFGQLKLPRGDTPGERRTHLLRCFQVRVRDWIKSEGCAKPIADKVLEENEALKKLFDATADAETCKFVEALDAFSNSTGPGESSKMPFWMPASKKRPFGRPR